MEQEVIDTLPNQFLALWVGKVQVAERKFHISPIESQSCV
jgi:hypothetical protein